MKLKDELENLTEPLTESEGFDLVELKVSLYKGSGRVQIFIDSDNGVTLDDCKRISRAVGDEVDKAGVFRGKYVLEVSSPGLDRPLKTFKEFYRRIGETVEIYFKDAAQSSVKGELIGADKRQIELRMNDKNQKLDLAGIKMGKIIF